MSPSSRTLRITPSPNSHPGTPLVLPRSREIYHSDFQDDNPGKSPLSLLSGEEVRSAIRRESFERVAEKSRVWSSVSRERDEELLVRIESEAREAALSRIQAENLVNAQYRLQRQLREQAREKRRQEQQQQQLTVAPEEREDDSRVPDGSVPAQTTAKHSQENVRTSVSTPDNSNTVVLYLEELRKNMQHLTPLISALPSLEALSITDTTREIHQRYRRVCQKASSLAASLASEAAGDSDVEGISDCVKETKSLIFVAEAELAKLREEDQKRKQAEQLAVESQLEALEAETEETKPIAVPSEKEAAAVAPAERVHQVFDMYSQKARIVKSSFSQLESDPALKTLKSAVLFASSNPVVICSANSPMEIIEPYRKAFLLLRGCEVDTNSVKIRLSDHPDIVHYVRFNMAKKFIDLACMQTEEKNEIKLFALATLITELWSCDREFGEVFLALLLTEYPVLLSYYGKASLKVEGNVDLQLKRLGALSKFYAAIMQTDRSFLLRRLFPTKPFDGKNPHGVEAAWELLSGLVNQEVQLGTTVLVLRNILSVAGWLMKKIYDKQFTKLMVYISRQVLPKIREKTPKELQGPVERLAELLDVFHRTQSVAVPENRLSEEFWMS